jgi:hypothetical protein
MAVNLSPVGGAAQQFFDNSGNVLTGGKIFTYAAGTSTPLASYTSSSGATPHANPIILDAAGRVPGGEIWITNNVAYKFILQDANNVLLGTYDNIVVSFADAFNIPYTPPFTGSVTTNVGDKLAQFLSIQDFGGVGDASTDDTAAVLAAINAIDEYGTILLNNGIFRITQNIHITKSINIIGTGVNSGFLLDLNTSTDGIKYGNVESLSSATCLFHSLWKDFVIYGETNSCKNGLILVGLIQCSFVNIHVMVGTASNAYAVIASSLQSCRPVEFNFNQFYTDYPIPCTVPANGFSGQSLAGGVTGLIDCEFRLIADGGMGYGINMQGMTASTLSGLSEGNSIYALALQNCSYNNIRNFYMEAGGATISLIDADGVRNVYGPGIFHNGNQVGIQLQECDGCVIDGVTITKLVIDSGTKNTKIGNISTEGQTISDIVDNGTATTQLNANTTGYLGINTAGQLSDFSSIVNNGSLERWVDTTTPKGSWSTTSATMTRNTAIVKHGVSSALCATASLYPAGYVRLTIPSLTTAISGNRVTVTGWIYVASGQPDVTIFAWYDSGAQVTGGLTVTEKNVWKKITLNLDVNYLQAYSTLQIIFAHQTTIGSFYLDGWSAVAGSAGGHAYFTPNANEFARYTGQATFNPGTIADGAFVAQNFTVLGATLGMSATAGAGVDVVDCLVTATVTAADTVTVVIQNETGGSVTLGSSTWYVSAVNITV